MIDQALLQAFGARLPKRASDAEFIDDDVYAAGASDPGAEMEPVGLVDRLYSEQLSAEPFEGATPDDEDYRRGIGMPTRLPTTKRAL